MECELQGDFFSILEELDAAVLNGFSASLEDESDFYHAHCRCAVRVYERYSFFGGNRVSLNVTLLEVGDRIQISAISSGGSQAIFFKVNTVGEESFLELLRDVIEKYQI